MKRIPIMKDVFAIVDDDDYEFLSKNKWFYSGGYAVRTVQTNKVRKLIYMHRVVAKTPDGLVTDHINGNKLDNRKSNLRVCTQNQNIKNRKSELGASIYKGVSRKKRYSKWFAQIKVDRKFIFLGSYEDEKEAARKYNEAAIKYHGEFARLNDV